MGRHLSPAIHHRHASRDAEAAYRFTEPLGPAGRSLEKGYLDCRHGTCQDESRETAAGPDVEQSAPWLETCDYKASKGEGMSDLRRYSGWPEQAEGSSLL